MKHKYIKYLVLIAAAALLFSCRRDSSENKPISEVKIGVIYPFSGSSQSTGNDIKSGLELALDIINHSYELPIPLAKATGLPSLGNAAIQLIYKDSFSDEKKASELVRELVVSDAAAIIGCYQSAVTSAASETAEMMKIPFLNADSTSPLLTQRGLKWFFRTTPDDMMFSENFFTFLSDIEKMNHEVPKRIVLVYENRLWGTSVARAERKLAHMYGYEIADDIPYNADDASFESELDRIQKAMPAIIMQTSYANDAIAFMKGYKARRIQPAAILGMNAGFISPSFLENLKADADYIFSREVWAVDLSQKKEIVRIVNDMFFQKNQRNMTGNSARAFTGLITLADAINRAASINPEKIRKAILETNISGDQLIMPWDGVSFDPETGQNTKGKGIIVQILNGEYRTVWPSEMQNRDIIYPLPLWSER